MTLSSLPSDRGGSYKSNFLSFLFFFFCNTDEVPDPQPGVETFPPLSARTSRRPQTFSSLVLTCLFPPSILSCRDTNVEYLGNFVSVRSSSLPVLEEESPHDDQQTNVAPSLVPKDVPPPRKTAVPPPQGAAADPTAPDASLATAVRSAGARTSAPGRTTIGARQAFKTCVLNSVCVCVSCTRRLSFFSAPGRGPRRGRRASGRLPAPTARVCV